MMVMLLMILMMTVMLLMIIIMTVMIIMTVDDGDSAHEVKMLSKKFCPFIVLIA